MAKFDPMVIEVFAESLYVQAASIIRTYTINGLGLGLVAGGAGGAALGSTVAILFALGLGAFGGYLGFTSGRSKAFALKLQAQTALCQVAIERNTRLRAGEIAA